MSRDSVAAWTLLVINILLVIGFFWYIDQQDQTIASLTAERDSLRGELVRRGIPVNFEAGDKIVLWEQPRLRVLNSFTPSGQIKTEWFWGDSLIETQWKSIDFPDTLKTRPMRRELPPRDAKP